MFTQLLRRRLVRLSVFVFVLTVLPALVASVWTYHQAYQRAQAQCPVGGLLDDAGHPDLIPRKYVGGDGCSYTVLVSKEFAKTWDAMPLDTPFTKEDSATVEAFAQQAGRHCNGRDRDYLPSFFEDHAAVPFTLAGVVLATYALLVALVWGLVWVWRGPDIRGMARR